MKTRTMLIAGAALATAAIGATTLGVAAAATTTTTSNVAGASSGQMLVIDARTDQADAVAALSLYQGASNRSFTPTTAPQFAVTDFSPVKGPDGNAAASVTGNAQSGQEMTAKVTSLHEESSSWSLGGSIEGSVGFDLAGVVDAELSAKFTANHTWTSSYTDSQAIEVTADPGKTVWVEVADSTVTYTGNFAFDAAGVHYEVDNVTMTQPGSATDGAMTSALYRVREMSSTDLGLPPTTRGGRIPLRALPRMNQVLTANR